MKELLALMQISSKIVYSNFMSEHRSAWQLKGIILNECFSKFIQSWNLSNLVCFDVSGLFPRKFMPIVYTFF
jgi:hypothetical protein